MPSVGCGTTLAGAALLTSGLALSAIAAATQLPGLSGDAPGQVDGIDPRLLDAYVLGAQYLDAGALRTGRPQHGIRGFRSPRTGSM